MSTDTAVTTTPNPSASSVRRKYLWYPGWTMVAIAATAQFMSAPGQSYSVAALKQPMVDSLGTSESAFALAYTVATLISAIMVPVFGRVLDRHGARLVLPWTAAGLGLACFGMSYTDSVTKLYVAFACIRTLGQGALFLISIWIVGEWFEHKRGIATAVTGIGGGLSVMLVPPFNNHVAETYGWQTTWFLLSIAVSASLIVPVIFLLRNRPEDIGLHPDGIDPDDVAASPDESHANAAAGPAITSLEDSLTVKQAIRDSTFWKLLAVPATSGLVGTGLVFHQVSLFAQYGLTSSQAVLLMTLQAICATSMAFPAGWATDRYPSRYLLFIAMTMLAAATLLVIHLPFPAMALAYAVLMGLHGSILRSTATVVWINYYGRAHQGEVRGFAWSVMIVGAAVGPLPLAWSFDATGSYAPALYAFLVIPVLAGTAVWTAYPPAHTRTS